MGRSAPWSRAPRSCGASSARADPFQNVAGSFRANPLERRAQTRKMPAQRILLMRHGARHDARDARPRERSAMSKLLKTVHLCAGMLALAAAPALAWEPTKAVEIVVAAGAGGASDQMARMLQAAVQKNNLMKQPMVVSLKGGASGAEALMYMKSSADDPNKFLIAYSLIYTLPLSVKLPFDWRDLTPVAVLAFDQFVLWDNTQLPYASVKDFVAAAKSASPPFKMGGTGSKREDRKSTRLNSSHPSISYAVFCL